MGVRVFLTTDRWAVPAVVEVEGEVAEKVGIGFPACISPDTSWTCHGIRHGLLLAVAVESKRAMNVVSRRPDVHLTLPRQFLTSDVLSMLID